MSCNQHNLKWVRPSNILYVGWLGEPPCCRVELTAWPLLQTNTVKAMNYLTSLFFAADAVMKMVAQGVLFTPTAYFQVPPLTVTYHPLIR